MKRPSPTPEPRNPRIILEADHAAIDGMLTELADEVRAEDRTIAPGTWDRIEGAVLAHINVEEMFVIPLLAAEDAEAAEGLLRAHADILHRLGEIGLAFDLHMVRADMIDDFCTRLRTHGAQEAELIYPIAERRLPVSTVRSLLLRLRAATPRKTRRTKAVAAPTQGR